MNRCILTKAIFLYVVDSIQLTYLFNGLMRRLALPYPERLIRSADITWYNLSKTKTKTKTKGNAVFQRY